jgi:hypothetical protein
METAAPDRRPDAASGDIPKTKFGKLIGSAGNRSIGARDQQRSGCARLNLRRAAYQHVSVGSGR